MLFAFSQPRTLWINPFVFSSNQNVEHWDGLDAETSFLTSFIDVVNNKFRDLCRGCGVIVQKMMLHSLSWPLPKIGGNFFSIFGVWILLNSSNGIRILKATAIPFPSSSDLRISIKPPAINRKSNYISSFTTEFCRCKSEETQFSAVYNDMKITCPFDHFHYF